MHYYMKYESIVLRIIRRFECFNCKYMWKEIVRKFSEFGKDILSKKGKEKIIGIFKNGSTGKNL